jgi:hypothetical protein
MRGVGLPFCTLRSVFEPGGVYATFWWPYFSVDLKWRGTGSPLFGIFSLKRLTAIGESLYEGTL